MARDIYVLRFLSFQGHTSSSPPALFLQNEDLYVLLSRSRRSHNHSRFSNIDTTRSTLRETTSSISNHIRISTRVYHRRPRKRWCHFPRKRQVLIELLEAIVPSPAPANPAAALSSIISVYAAHPTDFIASALSLPLGGLTWSDAVGLILGESPIENSSKSFNPINPSPAIYPMKGANDAPYSVSEATLRAAIYIPSDFTYRKVPPLLFIPGTGGTAGQNFAGNFAPLFKGSNYANAVFVNIPGNQLADIQVGRFPPLLFSSQKKTN